MTNKELLMSLLGVFTDASQSTTNLRIDERLKIKNLVFLEHKLGIEELLSFGYDGQYYAILYCTEKGNECISGEIIFDYGRLYYLLLPYNPSVMHGDFGLNRNLVRRSIYNFIKDYLSLLTNTITFESELFSIFLYYYTMQKLRLYPGNENTLSDEYFLKGEILARCAHLGIPCTKIRLILDCTGVNLIDNLMRNNGDIVYKLNRLLAMELTSCINIISAEFIEEEIYSDPKSMLKEYSGDNFIIVDAKEYKEPIPFIAEILSIIENSSKDTIILIDIDGVEGNVLFNAIEGMSKYHSKIERTLSGLSFELYGARNINSYDYTTKFDVSCDTSNYLYEILNFINRKSSIDN